MASLQDAGLLGAELVGARIRTQSLLLHRQLTLRSRRPHVVINFVHQESTFTWLCLQRLLSVLMAP